ncbi:MAG: hypothetical protein U1F12_08915 [Pseudomonadales bacterium]
MVTNVKKESLYVSKGPDGLYLFGDSKNGVTNKRLTNFFPRIAEERSIVDAEKEIETYFAIEILDEYGQFIGQPEIAAKDYKKLDWAFAAFGTRAEIYYESPHEKKLVMDYLKNTVDPSNRVTVYKNPGYAKVGQQVAFIHESGAIGGKDISASSKGIFDGFRKGYDFGAKIGDKNTKKYYVPTLLRLLDVGGKENQMWGFTVLLYILRSALTVIQDLPYATLYLVGPSGTFKSETARVMQACYGQKRHRKNAFLSWESSLASILKSIRSVSGTLIVLDDFVYDKDKRNLKTNNDIAAKVIRGIANTNIRDVVGTSPQDYYPVLVVTGEHPPEVVQESLLKRVIFCDSTGIKKSDISPFRVLAKSGDLAKSMRLFVAYIIRNIESIEKLWIGNYDEYCNSISEKLSDDQHNRTAEQYAVLLFSLHVYMDYLIKKKCIDETGSSAIRHSALDYMVTLASMQDGIAQGHSFKNLIANRVRCLVELNRLSFDVDEKTYFEKCKNKSKSRRKKCAGIVSAEDGTILLEANFKPSELFGLDWLQEVGLPTSKTSFYKTLNLIGMLSTNSDNRLATRLRPNGSRKWHSFYKLKISL